MRYGPGSPGRSALRSKGAKRGSGPGAGHRRPRRHFGRPLADVARDRHCAPDGDLGPARRDGGGCRVLGGAARVGVRAARRAAGPRPADRGGRGDVRGVRLRDARRPRAPHAARPADARGGLRVAAFEAAPAALARSRARAGRRPGRRTAQRPRTGVLAVLRRGPRRSCWPSPPGRSPAGGRSPVDGRLPTGGRRWAPIPWSAGYGPWARCRSRSRRGSRR